MPSKFVVIGLILLLGIGSVIALASIPSSAISGGNPVVVCNLKLSATGTYNDNGFSRWISGFNVAYSSESCHTQSLLDMLPSSGPQLNLFGFTFSLTATLVDSTGTNHCTCVINVNVPALQTSFGFTGVTTVVNVPVGSYTLVVNSPFPFNSGSGPLTFSEAVVVSSS